MSGKFRLVLAGRAAAGDGTATHRPRPPQRNSAPRGGVTEAVSREREKPSDRGHATVSVRLSSMGLNPVRVGDSPVMRAVRAAVQLRCADQSANLASSLAMLSIFEFGYPSGRRCRGWCRRGRPVPDAPRVSEPGFTGPRGWPRSTPSPAGRPDRGCSSPGPASAGKGSRLMLTTWVEDMASAVVKPAGSSDTIASRASSSCAAWFEVDAAPTRCRTGILR